MRDAFANRHNAVAVIDRAAEKNAVDLGCETWRFAKLLKAVESLFVMFNKFIKTFMCAAEGDAMGRTDEHIFGENFFRHTQLVQKTVKLQTMISFIFG